MCVLKDIKTKMLLNERERNGNNNKKKLVDSKENFQNISTIFYKITLFSTPYNLLNNIACLGRAFSERC